jgi:hypothetical protein
MPSVLVSIPYPRGIVDGSDSAHYGRIVTVLQKLPRYLAWLLPDRAPGIRHAIVKISSEYTVALFVAIGHP